MRLRDLIVHIKSSFPFINPVAFIILRNAGPHRVALESTFGPYRPKACYFDRLVRLVHLNVLFWFIKELLGIGDEVLQLLVNMPFLSNA